MKTTEEAIKLLNEIVQEYHDLEGKVFLLDENSITAIECLINAYHLDEVQIDYLDNRIDKLESMIDAHNTALDLVRMWSNQAGPPAKFRDHLDNYKIAVKELGGSDE